MEDLIAVFLWANSVCGEQEIVDRFPESYARVEQEDAGNVALPGEVVGEMNGHRAAVIGDEDEIVGLAPQENVWIERAEGGHAGIADTPDNQFGRLLSQAGEYADIVVLIEGVA